MARSPFTVSKATNGRELKIEFPGGLVNITTGLFNTNGQAVVHISVSADQYAGEPAWRCVPGAGEDKGIGMRLIQDKTPESEA